jgi:hypothetical protein
VGCQRRAPGRPEADYPGFARLDGRHPYRDAVPAGVVDYLARRRHDGRVAWFNFALAREMGLVPEGHPDRLNPSLERAILDAFCLVIVNEWDLAHGLRVDPHDLLPHPYMATRYLQLQHKCRRGTTSGDGRGVWNGTLTHRGVTWDVSSNGTGVTRLCPATARTGRFLRTANRSASYGCGTASLEDGMAAALMSETFHRNGIPTERLLALITLADGFAIVVRAGRNLLRPAHLFAPLKQRDLPRLRAATAYWLNRQEANGDLPRLPSGPARYRRMVEALAAAFGRTAATFEREYVFCWLAWDGDNILADGAIIDYGSIRQFGLYHRAYRFDDGPRWSTTIPEQRRMARHIVQTFAQARHFLTTGRKAPFRSFRHDPALRVFDRTFADWRDRLLLRSAGFEPRMVEVLLRHDRARVRRFDRAHAYFERARSARGPIPVPDGLTWNAIFSTRDLLRELPRLWREDPRPVPLATFLRLALSSYASRRDRRETQPRRRFALAFQQALLALIRAAARRTDRSFDEVLAELARRSAKINRFSRLTGDGAVWAARRLLRVRRRLGPSRFHQVVERFLDDQVLVPEGRATACSVAPEEPDLQRVLEGLLHVVESNRHGL